MAPSTDEAGSDIGQHPLLNGRVDDIAVIGGDQVLTYRELLERTLARQASLPTVRGRLVFLGASLSVATIVDYLALFGLGASIVMVDPATEGPVLSDWMDAYRPDLVIGLPLDHRPVTPDADCPPIADRMLLATSGSTGSPKFVRLSESNVVANGLQIAESLGLGPSERALCHLPLFYSFGLSILNSHLLAGGSVVLSSHSIIEAGFAEAIERHEVTSVSGVPYSFSMFRRTGLFQRSLPSLRHVTQAGGKLAVDEVGRVRSDLAATGRNLWLMYGQTEATARIAVLPPEEVADGANSVGYPVPGGRVEIVDPDEQGNGEVVYEGPNVMLGYSERRSDVNGIDTLGGRLPTGDLGRLDDAGRLVITGRLKRIAKVFGVRVNLDDVEQRVEARGRVAAIDTDRGITLFLEDADEETNRRAIERRLGLGPGSVDLVVLESLPRTASGKPDYAALKAL